MSRSFSSGFHGSSDLDQPQVIQRTGTCGSRSSSSRGLLQGHRNFGTANGVRAPDLSRLTRSPSMPVSYRPSGRPDCSRLATRQCKGLWMQTIAVLDFETANHQADSACQLGIAILEPWRIVRQKKWMIRSDDAKELKNKHLNLLNKI